MRLLLLLGFRLFGSASDAVESQSFGASDVERMIDQVQRRPKAPLKAPPSVPGEMIEVLGLTQSNINETLASHKSLFVLFHADWSAESEKMRYEFVAMAKALKKKVTLARVDVSIEVDLMRRFHVTSLPAFILLRSAPAKHVNYPRNLTRDPAIMMNWAKVRANVDVWSGANAWLKMEKRAVMEIDEENINETLAENELVFINFLANTCEECKNARPEWAAAAKYLKGKIPLASVDLASNRLGARFDMKEVPSFKLVGHGRSVRNYFGDRAAWNFVHWAEKEEVDYLEAEEIYMELDEEDFDEVVKEYPLLMVQFYTTRDGCGEEFVLEWARAARALKGTLRLARVHAVDERRLAERFDLDPNAVHTFPAVRLLVRGESIKAFHGVNVEKDIVAWAKKQLPSARKALNRRDGEL